MSPCGEVVIAGKKIEHSNIMLLSKVQHYLIYILFFSFLFIIIFFLLYNIVLVLPYINMHLPRVYMCSPSWTPFPPPSPYHPSGSSQCTSPKLPVSCIEPGLAIHFLYDVIHVLMPFSQSIPTSLSHRVQKTVLYICVSLSYKNSLYMLNTSYYRWFANILSQSVPCLFIFCFLKCNFSFKKI